MERRSFSSSPAKNTHRPYLISINAGGRFMSDRFVTQISSLRSIPSARSLATSEKNVAFNRV